MERGKRKLLHVTSVYTANIREHVQETRLHRKRKPHDGLCQYFFKTLLSILLGVTPRSGIVSKGFEQGRNRILFLLGNTVWLQCRQFGEVRGG